jgi:hypothetical protein
MMRSASRALLLAVGMAALVLGVANPAAAATYALTGTLNTSGTLVQYSTYRPHISGGASLRVYDNTGCSANRWSRFGLRINDSSQFTNSNQYNGDGGDRVFTRASNGSRTLPTNDYAINGRMANQTGQGCDNYWEGVLTL